MSYLDSSKVKVFPSAYRGTATSGANIGSLYDPESRLTNEKNVINLLNRLAFNDSYVVSYENNILLCCIHGYWFELDLTGQSFTENYIYAHIKVDDVNSQSSIFSYKGTSLRPLEGTGDVLDSSDVFIGLEIEESAVKKSYTKPNYGLLIFSKVSGSYSIPNESKFRISSRAVQNLDSSANITEELNTGNIIAENVRIGDGHLQIDSDGYDTWTGDNWDTHVYADKIVIHNCENDEDWVFKFQELDDGEERYIGSVRSVRVQATSPVQSSQSTTQTDQLNTTISLANGYGDTKNPYGAKVKNTVLAGPDGSSGHTADAVPSFRALVAADLPDNYGDNKNPYASKTKNYVLAAPSSAAGAPSFRALVSSDLPTSYGDNKNPYAAKGHNKVLAGPSSSTAADAAPTFRALVAADIPNLAASKITSGVLATARQPIRKYLHSVSFDLLFTPSSKSTSVEFVITTDYNESYQEYGSEAITEASIISDARNGDGGLLAEFSQAIKGHIFSDGGILFLLGGAKLNSAGTGVLVRFVNLSSNNYSSDIEIAIDEDYVTRIL